MSIALVLGTRPDIIKMFPVIRYASTVKKEFWSLAKERLIKHYGISRNKILL
jgi:hypothetical protein